MPVSLLAYIGTDQQQIVKWSLKRMKRTLVIPVCAVLLVLVTGDQQCPWTWFYHPQKGDQECVCGADLGGAVSCDNTTREVAVLVWFCMTYDNKDNITVVGKCIFPFKALYSSYVKVPQNVSKLEEKCHTFNRRGRLCGQCRENFHIPTYSFDFKCMKCTSGVLSNVIWYVAVAFVPLTVFFLVIFLFRINVSSPQFNSMVAICQLITNPFHIRSLLFWTKGTQFSVFAKILTTVYGIWNLDFFRTVIPPICLPLTTLQIIALDYIVAIYPLVLLLIFFALITAYERGFQVVVCILRPFHQFSARFRRQWHIKRSVIDGFASFVLLSYMKILYTSSALLIGTAVYDVHGHWRGDFLYLDPSIAYLSAGHLPYAICAVFFSIVVVILPVVLLLLYPMIWFQRCLNRLGMNSSTLRQFMQYFQGHYRDRTDGGRECRYYAVMYPSARMALFLAFSLTLNPLLFPLIIFFLLAVALVLVFYQPYRHPYTHYNKIDLFFLFMISAYCLFLIMLLLDYEKQVNVIVECIFLVILSFLPLLYFFVLFVGFVKKVLRQNVIPFIQRKQMVHYVNL